MTSAELRPPIKNTVAISAMPVPSVPVLWITGLSGVGKSTLARALVAALVDDAAPPLLLDGDVVRQHLDAHAQRDRHDLSSRRRRAWRLARLAHALALRSRPVVVATISLFHEVQDWNRRQHSRYGEILLNASTQTLRQRNPDLYDERDGRPPSNVWGLDLLPEFPETAELVLQQTFDPPGLSMHLSQAVSLWRQLERR